MNGSIKRSFKQFQPFNRCAPFKPLPSVDVVQDMLSSAASPGEDDGGGLNGWNGLNDWNKAIE